MAVSPVPPRPTREPGRKIAAFLQRRVSVIWILLVLILVWSWYSSSLVLLSSKPTPLQISPKAFGVPFEIARFASKDGTPLSGWFLAAPSPSDKTILVCHGWGAHKADVLPSTVFLNTKGGYNLFYFDFRAHGESGMAKCSLGPLESQDLEAALNYMLQEKPSETKRLAAFGLSMGGAVAMAVAARRPEILGVAAESAFSSFNDVVARYAKIFYHLPRYPLVSPFTLFFVRLRLGLDPEQFSPIHQIAKISPRPLILIQGDSDPRMPVSEGEKLFAAAGEPKELWTVPGADHGDPGTMHEAEYQKRLLGFFEKVFQPVK